MIMMGGCVDGQTSVKVEGQMCARSMAQKHGEMSERVIGGGMGVKKNGLYGWKMVVVDQQPLYNIHTKKVNTQPTSTSKLKSISIFQQSKQIVNINCKKRTEEDNLVRVEKLTSAEDKLLEDDPGTLSQDKNFGVVKQSFCSSLQDDIAQQD